MNPLKAAYLEVNRLGGDIAEFYGFSEEYIRQQGQWDEFMAKVKAYDEAMDKLQKLIWAEVDGVK